MGKLIFVGCLAALLLFVIIFGGWYVSTRNHMVTLDQQVQGQWSQVENVYQRRFDLIPNLVRTVQGAANFEKSTLQAVIDARARVGQVAAPAAGGPPTASAIPNNPQALAQFDAAQQNLSGALGRLFVVVERYPELKATENYRELQSELEGTENRISVERRRYTEVVQGYNTAIALFPASIVANMSNFQPKAYFKSTSGAEKPPEVQFK